jgi:hypothetical protein
MVKAEYTVTKKVHVKKYTVQLIFGIGLLVLFSP